MRSLGNLRLGAARGGRRNLIVNSRFAGAVPGRPGAAPDGWNSLQTGGELEILAGVAGDEGHKLRVYAGAARQVYAQASPEIPPGALWTYSIRLDVAAQVWVQEVVNAFALPPGTVKGWLVDGAPAEPTDPLPEGAGLTVSVTLATGEAGGAASLRFGVGLISPQSGDIAFYDPALEAGAGRSPYRST